MAKNCKISYEELLDILSHSYDEILVFDADGDVVYVTDSCIEHYGQNAEEMMGKRSQDLVEQNFWGPRVSPLAMRHKKRITMEQKSCTGAVLLTTATPIFDQYGDVKYIIENVREVTEGGGVQKEIDDTKDFLGAVLDEEESDKVGAFVIENFVANSDVMQDLIKMSWRIAEVNSNVLITGDSGTGKSVMARYIHRCSPRKEDPFVEINCAALPETLIESELFGYTKGAFSGAISKGKKGLIRTAEKGTLFLDEIGEMPLAVQAKLLHFIQDATYFEVGGTQEQRADCRIVAATNQNLEAMVAEGRFRQDLYYRLKVFEIVIPPLTQREDDVIPLIHFFLHKYNEKYRLHQQFSKECIDVLSAYPWPGNVRELSNAVEQMVVMSTEGTIMPMHIPKGIRKSIGKEMAIKKNTAAKEVRENAFENDCYMRFMQAQDKAEKVKSEVVRELFSQVHTTRKVAAQLKISQSTAQRYIQRYCQDLL